MAAPSLLESAFKQIAVYAGEASRQGVKLLMFPEVFIFGYPRGLTFGNRSTQYNMFFKSTL
ncbi:nitrilase-related carbon-nitrogen hydrolase [Paenibacillus algorifonticola]|uniref:nitrilase-related carbon-nitrogen hydrolase n=1 Tax=Paenibacillus algorifonticola TaxID=684063 RepID=UPI003D292BE9